LAFLPLLLAACSDGRPYLQRAAARLDACDPAGARLELEGPPSATRDQEEFKQLSSRLEAPDPAAAGEHVRAAVDLFGRGDEARGRAEVGAACRLDPGNPDARLLLDGSSNMRRSLALVGSGQGRLDRCEAAGARKDLEAALRLWPGNEKARGLLAGLGKRDAERARESEKAAKVFLAGGQVREAEGELAQACRLDPESATARKLLAQLTADPNEYFRKHGFPFSDKSFPWIVQPGDTLSKLAGRHLRDEDLFYLLARYNGLTNPNDLRVGQTLRIPGELRADDQPPTVSAEPGGGRYRKAVAVSLAARDDTDPKPRIWYTIDGGPPAPGKGTPYTRPVEIGCTTTLKYLAVDSAGNASKVGEEAYVFDEAPPTRADCSDDPYRKAVQAWRRQDLDATVALCDRATACDPGHHNAEILRVQAIDAMVNLCRVACEKKECDEAVAQCERALKHDPDNRKALELRRQAAACRKR
jgi:nucleoid-associated protein YgaU